MMPPEYLKLRVLEAVRQRPMPRRAERFPSIGLAALFRVLLFEVLDGFRQGLLEPLAALQAGVRLGQQLLVPLDARGVVQALFRPLFS